MKLVRYKVNTNLHSDYSIDLVTDLHSCPGTEVIERIEQNKPDIIAIAGDLVDTHLRDNAGAINFLKSCVNISYTVLSLGNHE